MIYLSKDEVAAIHVYVMSVRWNESLYGLRDPALLESALNRPVNASLYSGSDLFDQAARLLEGLIVNHPFLQGNKRTAYAATEVFLLLNGWKCTASDEAVIALCLSIATGDAGAEEAALLFSSNSAPWVEQ